MWENIGLGIQGILMSAWNLILTNPVFGLMIVLVMVLLVFLMLSWTQAWASTFLKGAVMVIILVAVIMLIFIANQEFGAAEGISSWLADIIPTTKEVINEGANRTNLLP